MSHIMPRISYIISHISYIIYNIASHPISIIISPPSYDTFITIRRHTSSFTIKHHQTWYVFPKILLHQIITTTHEWGWLWNTYCYIYKYIHISQHKLVNKSELFIKYANPSRSQNMNTETNSYISNQSIQLQHIKNNQL